MAEFYQNLTLKQWSPFPFITLEHSSFTNLENRFESETLFTRKFAKLSRLFVHYPCFRKYGRVEAQPLKSIAVPLPQIYGLIGPPKSA